MLLYGTIVLTAERTRTPLSSRLPCHPETGRQAQMFTLSSSPTRDSSVQRSALPLSAHGQRLPLSAHGQHRWEPGSTGERYPSSTTDTPTADPPLLHTHTHSGDTHRVLGCKRRSCRLGHQGASIVPHTARPCPWMSPRERGGREGRREGERERRESERENVRWRGREGRRGDPAKPLSSSVCWTS